MRKPREGSLCPSWPRCRCIVQGYVNHREPDGCGRAPRQPRWYPIECEHGFDACPICDAPPTPKEPSHAG